MYRNPNMSFALKENLLIVITEQEMLFCFFKPYYNKFVFLGTITKVYFFVENQNAITTHVEIENLFITFF